MSSISPDLIVGQGVAHAEMGVGVFVGLAAEGYARVFFQGHGERQVPLTALVRERSWEEQVVAERIPLRQMRFSGSGSPSKPSSCPCWKTPHH